MNNKFAKLNDNLAIVTDDIGKIRAISIDDNKNIEIILVKENIIEKANSELERVNTLLENFKNWQVEVLAVIIIFIASIFVNSLIFGQLLSWGKILFLAAGLGCTTIIPITIARLGNIFTLKKRLIEAGMSKKRLEEDIPNMEKELEKLKEKAHFQELTGIQLNDLDAKEKNNTIDAIAFCDEIIKEANNSFKIPSSFIKEEERILEQEQENADKSLKGKTRSLSLTPKATKSSNRK